MTIIISNFLMLSPHFSLPRIMPSAHILPAVAAGSAMPGAQGFRPA
ncbi:MAG: hypothetical protein FWG50_05705 [Kiritimatiellaeota bacterium]|nr:hypothetical protein [Kiritimatiellota bacterium]